MEKHQPLPANSSSPPLDHHYYMYYDSSSQQNYFCDATTHKTYRNIPPGCEVTDMRKEEDKKKCPQPVAKPAIAVVNVVSQEDCDYAKLMQIFSDKFTNVRGKQEEKNKKRATMEGADNTGGKAVEKKAPGDLDSVSGDEEEAPAEHPAEPDKPKEDEEEEKEEPDAVAEDKLHRFRMFRAQQISEYMKRPARKQIQDIKKDTAYHEGNYDYNIWYDKYLTDRKQEREKVPSLYKCNPELDTGYTRADLMEKASSYFCVYFARGCCAEGAKCRFFHRVPQPEDLANEDNMRDIFGRIRHASFKDDMSGVGTFNKECRTLLVRDLKAPENTPTPVKDMVKKIYEEFSKWGEIDDINYFAPRANAFIKYTHRYYAEFAKEAMQDQGVGGNDCIHIRWCLEDLNEKSRKVKDKEQEQQFYNAVLRKKKLEEEERIKAVGSGEKAKIAGLFMGMPQLENKEEEERRKKQEAEIAAKKSKLSEVLERIDKQQEEANSEKK